MYSVLRHTDHNHRLVDSLLISLNFLIGWKQHTDHMVSTDALNTVSCSDEGVWRSEMVDDSFTYVHIYVLKDMIDHTKLIVYLYT